MVDTRALLVFFWSERSGPARRMESPLAHLERKERLRLRVSRIDIDAAPELAARFGVSSAPTMLFIRNRRIVARHEGRASMPQIERLLETHLWPARDAGLTLS